MYWDKMFAININKILIKLIISRSSLIIINFEQIRYGYHRKNNVIFSKIENKKIINTRESIKYDVIPVYI